MGGSWTNVFFSHPWLGSVVWIVLHSLDYYLTLYTARLYKAGAERFLDFDGSFELNPMFQEDVDHQRLLPPSFLRTLLVPAIFLFAVTMLVRGQRRWVAAFALGLYIFPTAAVIAGHITRIWLFRRALGSDPPFSGHLKYERKAAVIVSVLGLAETAGILAIATCLAPNAWTLGGVVGLAWTAFGLRRRALQALPKGAVPKQIGPVTLSRRRLAACLISIVLGILVAVYYLGMLFTYDLNRDRIGAIAGVCLLGWGLLRLVRSRQGRVLQDVRVQLLLAVGGALCFASVLILEHFVPALLGADSLAWNWFGLFAFLWCLMGALVVGLHFLCLVTSVGSRLPLARRLLLYTTLAVGPLVPLLLHPGSAPALMYLSVGILVALVLVLGIRNPHPFRKTPEEAQYQRLTTWLARMLWRQAP